jgi:acetamidase/formamidase
MNCLKTALAAATMLGSGAVCALAQDAPTIAPPIEVDRWDGPYRSLQPLEQEAGPVEADGSVEGEYYLPSDPDAVMWGYLPNRTVEPVLTVPSGATVTVDTVSHEGVLEDQGRDPAAYFTQFGVPSEHVLSDAIAVAGSSIEHDFIEAGPHVVTGPIAIEGAEPGDVLMVETLSIAPRVPYGVISNRHGKGALPGEYPLGPEPDEDASAENPEAYRNVSIFTPLRYSRGELYGVLNAGERGEVVFPATPFMGLMGVAADTDEPVHSVPPAEYGGNIDVKDLGAGSTLYLPVQVAGANFYTGDPHAAQGDGEVALTALELSARTTFRLTVLKAGDPRLPLSGEMVDPFGETDEFWIPVGLDPDLDEAMKNAVRTSIAFLTDRFGMDPQTAYAYLSAATDFAVSQVVDRTKGIHAKIRKSDFADLTEASAD